MSPYYWRKNVANLSIEEVAELTSISIGYISKIENGKSQSLKAFKVLQQVSNKLITLEGFLKGKKYEEEQEARQCSPA